MLSRLGAGYRGLPLAFEHLWFLIVLLGFIFTYALRPRVSRLVPTVWRPLLGLDPGTWRWPCSPWRCGAPG
jgi:glucan biosynthesis protein C